MTAGDPPIPHPRYHLAPPWGWMNDPNGLVWHQGLYHFFYQHNPYDIVWGPMHWGHAVSSDLLSWQHRPVALAPDDLGTIFSGCAVIDVTGSAGLGAGAIVLVFTHHDGTRQCQSLAFSNDAGETWQKYAGNPVLEAPAGLRDFRDPKVYRWDDEWIMVVAAGHELWFYRSSDLRAWHRTSTFTADIGVAGAVWETPDVFSLPIEGEAGNSWILSIGVSAGAPSGGTGMAYVAGQFDGSRFHAGQPPTWADSGPDYYAAQSWYGDPQGRVVWVGWVDNEAIPATRGSISWRGQASIPRSLSLVRRGDRLVLRQTVISEIADLRSDSISLTFGDAPETSVRLDGPAIELSMEVEGSEGVIVLTLSRSVRSLARLTFDAGKCLWTLDRTVGSQELVAAGSWQGTGSPATNVRILLDVASIEVFIDGGIGVFTASLPAVQSDFTQLTVSPRGRLSGTAEAYSLRTSIAPS
jgi:fructan beta-fructosidase